MSKAKKISGTAEWAAHNANILIGCTHDCRYCYSRYNAVERFKTMDKKAWTMPLIQRGKLMGKVGKKKGTIMFPTQHDILPEYLDVCIQYLLQILEAGNQVLIVSKPHLECIEKICDKTKDFKDQILFRFTIGADDDDLLGYWEPKAPGFEERLASLKHAYDDGFSTSVSMEPMLDSPNVLRAVEKMRPFVTDALWIGKLNHIDERVKVETNEDKAQVARIEAGQTDERILEIHEVLKDDPLIKWKESVKSIVGLDLATEAGADV